MNNIFLNIFRTDSNNTKEKLNKDVNYYLDSIEENKSTNILSTLVIIAILSKILTISLSENYNVRNRRYY